MRLFDALAASPAGCARRLLTDGDDREGLEPNVVLVDGRRPKAFRALEEYAWERRPLRRAKALSDWEPSPDRREPFPLVAGGGDPKSGKP